MLKKIILVFSLSFFISSSYGQTLVWSEDFSNYINPSGIEITNTAKNNVGSYPSSVSKWTLDLSAVSPDGGSGASDWFYVTNNEFSGKDLDAEAIWTSESINISGYSNIKLSVDLAEDGVMESNDYFKVYYKLDGGAETQFAVNGYVNDDFTSATAEQTGLSGTSVVIIIKCQNHADNEFHTFDNVKVMEMTSNSTQSDIIKTTGWSEPTNIDYTLYSAANNLTTSNSIEVAGFTIRDGGGSVDADNVTTKLTAVVFNVLEYENLAALALFNGSTNVAEVTSFASSSVSFSGINIEATDGGTKDYTLRATFKSTVTDNVNLKYTISDAIADIAGSGFAASDAGGATTDNTSNNNKLVVTADHLLFTTNKPPSSVHINTDFEVEVKAVDANNNVDLDATNSITLARATGTGTLSSTIGLTQSLVAGVYFWTDVQYDVGETFKIEAQTASLTNVTSHDIISSIRAWINEFHYDNVSTDSDEFVEICIENASGFDLSDFTVTLYNGNGGGSYNSETLDNFTVGNTYDNITVYTFNFSSLQNDKEGIALSYDDGSKAVTVLEFLSYEGVLTATNGPANGLTSTDVGVRENATPAGETVQRYGNNDDSCNWKSEVASTKGLENVNQTLPIELISFTARREESIFLLNWQTATETNNEFFTIERSYDAQNFDVIGIVKGAGNSNSLLYYSFSDNDISNNSILYYRLKQTDYDGKYSYSKTISVSLNITETQLLKQYVVDGNLFVEIKNGKAQNMQVELLDFSGKLIQLSIISTQKGINSYRIKLQSIPEGIYLMRIYSDTEIMVAKLFVN